MLNLVLLGIVVFGLLMICWCFWQLYCNKKTYDQLGFLLEKIQLQWSYDTHEDVMQLYADLDLVKYETHLWYVCTFRNPKQLYSERIQKLLEK